jgi:LMBR1 domain-containing protein 1
MADVPNIFLIILLVVIPLLTAFLCFLFLVLFSSPVDRWQGWFPKLIVLFGMTLGICAIFILPFDVWNSTQRGGLDKVLPVLWQILFAVIAVMILIVLPFTFFYYEAHDPERDEDSCLKGIAYQILAGTVSAGILAVIVCAIVGITYAFLGEAQIPVTYYTSDTFRPTVNAAIDDFRALDCPNCQYKYDWIYVQMSFIVYFTGCLSIVGWLGFVVCAGCGMSSLPLGCLLSFCKKPKRIGEDEYHQQQKLFAKRAEKLIEVGQKVDQLRKKGRAKPKAIRAYREFKQAVTDMEDDWKFIKIAFEDGGGSIWPYVIYTFVGFVSTILTITWLVHIIIYLLPPFPLWPFLNIFFQWLDTTIFPLFGLALYGVFALYLLICAIFGNVQVASRLPLISVFPLKYKDTMLNSFIFNTGLLLLISITVVQFCTNAFSQYTRFTSIDAYFNTQIYYTKGLHYFFKYIHYVFFVFIFIGAVLTGIFSLIKTDKQKRIEKILADTAL